MIYFLHRCIFNPPANTAASAVTSSTSGWHQCSLQQSGEAKVQQIVSVEGILTAGTARGPQPCHVIQPGRTSLAGRVTAAVFRLLHGFQRAQSAPLTPSNRKSSTVSKDTDNTELSDSDI